MAELQRTLEAMRRMYTQEHVDKLEREIQKGNLLLLKVQSRWQQAQLSAGSAGGAAGGENTPRPDWSEVQEKLQQVQVEHTLLM